jgi:beta-D-xylosidase 4
VALNASTEIFVNLGNNARLDADGFVPFGIIENYADLDVVRKLYSKYGELNETALCPKGHSKHGAPCKGPKILRMVQDGNAYLEADFPLMDYTRTARLVAYEANGANSTAPLYHGCLDSLSRSLPYCDTSLSYEARARDLLGRLSINEKVNLLSGHTAPYCGATTKSVPSVGLPAWKWLTETNTMAAGCATASGMTRCSTVFVGPLGVAASFNRSAWWLKGDVVSTQVRAHNNIGDNGVGLTGYGPNINTVKDPRYGRNSELASESPFLSGQYAASFVRGMQQISNVTGHLKMISYLKHYTAYSKEAGRFSWKANVTDFDMFDSNLPQYEVAFKQGGASGAMCSYFAANGVPSCGSNFLMNDMVRTRWRQPNAVFMSDCSAVANFEKNGFAANDTDASARALNAGLDVYGGWNDHLWQKGDLAAAIDAGMTTEAKLDDAVVRTTLHKLKAGVFDPLDRQDPEWMALGVNDLNSSTAQAVAYEIALQSLVLLKNDDGVLPLQRGIKLAVVGPMAVETIKLRSDYASWHENGAQGVDLPPSIADALERANTGGVTTVAPGVEVDSQNSTGVAGALDAVANADAVVMVLGITRDQEHEGMDRSDTLLPGLQTSFALQVFAKAGEKKPVILVLCNGGIISVDELVSPAQAIVEAFNPVDHGTKAIAESLFGGENRWGKLPVTIILRRGLGAGTATLVGHRCGRLAGDYR